MLAMVLWVATFISGAPHLGNHPPTLQFDTATQRVSGSGGCNQYNGTYVNTGHDLTFGTLSVTRMMCDTDTNAVETAFLRDLDHVRTASWGKTVLFFYGEDGKKIVQFEKQSP
jgi:heat shock protein HslJ